VAAIWAHKLRSALTLLGMIVGVTAFVTVVSLIQGFNVYIDEKIAGIGAKSFPSSDSIPSKISRTPT
jgi:putative ABC transport system permease protein